MPEELVFSNTNGQYIKTKGLSKEEYLRYTLTLGRGGWPYEFDRRYEACESFKIFKDRQVIVNPIKFRFADQLKYTFGLEFESYAGYIPEDIIFRDGLIPLRDGSLDGGLEYSTVVLKGEEGLNLLKQEVDTLKKYTAFNKECALHIHMGGYPLRARKVFNLYRLCIYLQDTGQIKRLVPEYTFNSQKYKKSGKNYCNPLPTYGSFEDLYYALVGTSFCGNFRQPHPQDPNRDHKWQIHTRYYWINFINFFCYNVNKTIEFRFLRPTYNFKKIEDWLYIFNGIMKYAEAMEEPEIRNNLTLTDIMYSVYPKELADILRYEIVKLEVERNNQRSVGDFCGDCLQFEDKYFDCNDLI